MTAGGGAIAALGVTVIIGRFTEYRGLVTLLPDGAPMAFMTALNFILCGLAFVAHGVERGRVGRLAAGRAGRHFLCEGTLHGGGRRRKDEAKPGGAMGSGTQPI